jgi:hypothetical protein
MAPEYLRSRWIQPGLDHGTLGAILEHSGPSLDVQICWSTEGGRSPKFSEILPSLIHWQGKSSYTGLANVRFATGK